MSEVFVSNSGDNSRTYVQAQVEGTPWLTWAKCQTSATNNDTVTTLAGTHTNSGMNVAYSLSKGFTFRGKAAPSLVGGIETWTTIVDAANNHWGIGPATGNYITVVVRNLEFRNYTCAGGGTGYSFGISGSAGTGSFSTLTVDHCKFKTWKTASQFGGGGCIGGSWGSDTETWSIHHNIFDDISDNNVAGSFGNIFNMRAMSASTACTIYNNTIYLPETTAANVIDGLFYLVSSTGGTLTWKNNIVYSATSLPFKTGSGAFATNTVSYNDHYNITGVPAGTGNLTSDPLLASPIDGCFELRNNGVDVISPCIDTGISTI